MACLPCCACVRSRLCVLACEHEQAGGGGTGTKCTTHEREHERDLHMAGVRLQGVP